jgi:mono/diheme cytochrome c family protein
MTQHPEFSKEKAMLTTRFIRTALLAMVATTPAMAAGLLSGASVDLGRKAYAANCASCHFDITQPTFPSILAGANNPSIIKSAIGGVSEMRRQTSLASLSDADVSNIAIYIAKNNTTDSDRVFDWGQKTFPTLLAGTVQSGTVSGYYYRYFSKTNVYVGTLGDVTTGGHLFYYDPKAGGIADLGTIQSYLPTAQAAGF